jgi:hypothetical protein
MAIKINNDIVIDNDKKFYGDGYNLTNVAKNLIVGVRVGTAISTPIGIGSLTVFGRTLNTNVTTV